MQKMNHEVSILAVSKRDHTENFFMPKLLDMKHMTLSTNSGKYLCEVLNISWHNFDAVCMMFAKSHH